MSTFTYQVGPLSFCSNIELPFETAPADMSSAAVMIVELLPGTPPPSQECRHHEVRNEQGIWLFDGDLAKAFVPSHNLAYISRDTLKEPHPFQTVTAVIRLILALRDIIVLHGSAVLKDEGAWLWLGESGSGKSTSAVREVLQGAIHLNDDMTPLCFNSKGQVCTFQYDPIASIYLNEDGLIPGLERPLPAEISPLGQREDGKSLLALSQPTGQLYPVRKVYHLVEAGVRAQCAASSDQSIRLLLKSIVGYKIAPYASNGTHLSIIAALVRQVSTGQQG